MAVSVAFSPEHEGKETEILAGHTRENLKLVTRRVGGRRCAAQLEVVDGVEHEAPLDDAWTTAAARVTERLVAARRRASRALVSLRESENG